MRAFQYLSMFDLFMRYKTNKTNVVFDALSRLSRNSIIIMKDDSKILKALYERALEIRDFSFKKKKSFLEKLIIIYYIILVEMFNDFKSHFFFEYIKNEQ